MNAEDNCLRNIWKQAIGLYTFREFFQKLPAPVGRGRINRLLGIAFYRELGIIYDTKEFQDSAALLIKTAEDYADKLIPLSELSVADLFSVDLYTMALTHPINYDVPCDICEDALIHNNTAAVRRGLAKRFFQIMIDSLGLGLTFKKQWATTTAISLARSMYEARDFSAMPILADALQDAGCDSEYILNRLRDNRKECKLDVWYRGCWVVDKLLGKR